MSPLPEMDLPGIDAAARFRAAGLPFTIQRRMIWEAFAERNDHPTADILFRAIADSAPGLSRTTVYRTLESLVELGLARRICHPGAAVRYDPKTSRHHHLVCDQCGAVFDLEDARLDRLRLPELEETGFAARDFTVLVSGTCGDCRKR